MTLQVNVHLEKAWSPNFHSHPMMNISALLQWDGEKENGESPGSLSIQYAPIWQNKGDPAFNIIFY